MNDPSPAALVTSWGNAWLAGLAGLDDLVEALRACTGQGAGVVRIPEPAGQTQPLLLHLGQLRRDRVAWFRLALPAPGDVADLAGPQEAQRAALAAGAAVIGGRSATRPMQGGIVLVPPPAADDEPWRCWPADVTAWTLVSPAEAEHDLLACLRAVTEDLIRLDVARDDYGARADGGPGGRAAIGPGGRAAVGPGGRAAVGPGGRAAASPHPLPLRIPPGLPARSIELLNRCDRVSTIIAAACRDDGAAISRHDSQGRSSALARLAAATRRARAQAWSAGALALTPAS